MVFTTIYRQESPMITPPPHPPDAFQTFAPRGDPLDNLISKGIAVGNSILGDILSSGPQSTTTSTSSRTKTSAASHESTERKSSTSMAQSTTATDRPSTASSPANSNNTLIIILAVVLGVLATVFTAFVVWICIRRRKMKRAEKDDEYPRAETPPPVAPMRSSQSYGGFNERQNDHYHTIPAPPATLLAASHTSDHTRDYDHTPRSSHSDTNSTAPFLTPTEGRDTMSAYNTNTSNKSSELEGTPVSPIAASEGTPISPLPPAEMEAGGPSGAPWLPRKSSQRNKRVHYPPISESSRFDFGFGRGRSKEDEIHRGKFKIPRRPIPN